MLHCRCPFAPMMAAMVLPGPPILASPDFHPQEAASTIHLIHRKPLTMYQPQRCSGGCLLANPFGVSGARFYRRACHAVVRRRWIACDLLLAMPKASKGGPAAASCHARRQSLGSSGRNHDGERRQSSFSEDGNGTIWRISYEK